MANSSLRASYHGLSAEFRFWSYLILDLLSIVCTFFVLYHLLFDRLLRRALYNHIIIVLLIVGLIYEFTNIPWILHSNRTGSPMFPSQIFYRLWSFIDIGWFSLQVGLFTWATIERHILIFHDRWVSTKRRRFYFHYAPIVIIIVYYLIYWSIIHFTPFCQNMYDDLLAGSTFIPCVFSRTFLGTFDLMLHQVIPTLMIAISSMALIIRVIAQKRRLNQPMKWRRHRKMMIQLISLTRVYVIVNFPWRFLVLAFQCGLSEETFQFYSVFTGYIYYYVIFLFPIASCGSLSELRRKFLQFFRIKHHPQEVQPL